MSKLSLTEGRIGQKLKTREALLVKGNELLAKGIPVNLETAAKAAGISKATAYRYFADSASFQREAALQLKAQTREDLFGDIPAKDLDQRLQRLIDYHFRLFIRNEKEFRLFLGSVVNESVLSRKPPSRGGRRVVLIEEALVSLRSKVDKTTFGHMVHALSLVFGIESITILKDLCHLSNKEILENWRWMVHRIVYQTTKG